MNDSKVEEYVERDMTKQKDWVQIMQPSLSCLKFRLPWGPGATKYLKGRVLIQAFPPCTSTETRLLVPKEALNDELEAYDQEEYEEKLMHHNTITRASLHCHSHDVQVEGLDGCWDCAALVHTASRLVARDHGKEVASELIAAEIESLIKHVGQSGRTLATRYHVSTSRHQGRQFEKRRYYDSEGNDFFTQEKPRKPRRGR